MKVNGDDVYFECSGRKEYANNGVIGMGPDGAYASAGHDGCLGAATDFTPAERAELADYMIGLWQTFKGHGATHDKEPS